MLTKYGTYGPDTQSLVYSAGKSLSSYGYAVAVSKGIISYDQLVMRDWPEFGSDEGKKALKLHEVLEHRSGIDSVSVPISTEMMLPENLKKNSFSKVLEQEKQIFPNAKICPSTKAAYHRTIRDSIAGEVMRKALGGNMTFGEWMEQEVTGPLAPEDKPEAFFGFRGTEDDLNKIA